METDKLTLGSNSLLEWLRGGRFGTHIERMLLQIASQAECSGVIRLRRVGCTLENLVVDHNQKSAPFRQHPSGFHSLLTSILWSMEILQNNGICGLDFRPHHVYFTSVGIILKKRIDSEINGLMMRNDSREAVRFLLYCAPETIRGDVDARTDLKYADIWGFGCLLLFILSEQDPQYYVTDVRGEQCLLNEHKNPVTSITIVVGSGNICPEYSRHSSSDWLLQQLFSKCFQLNPVERGTRDSLEGWFNSAKKRPLSFPEVTAEMKAHRSGAPYEEDRNLGQAMRQEIVVLDVQRVRQCTRSVLDSVTGNALFGGIFLDNVMYRPTSYVYGNYGDPQLAFSLCGPRDTTQLWSQWITEQSSNIAYIPPEEILASGDRSKVDSWALGCLVIQLLSCGEPLKLRRNWRYAHGTEYFNVKEPEILVRLREFYTSIGQEHFVVGPAITVDKVPHACEEFLALCLDPLPAHRWSLERLRKHPFVDLSISLERLSAMEVEYYRTLPLVNHFTVNNLRPHPYLANSTLYSILVGNSPNVRRDQPNGAPVEVWKFQLLDEFRDRDLYARAYGKLVDLLMLDSSDDEAVRQRAACYRIRALQHGHQNVVQHYGCQFTPRPNTYSMPEFLVFSEHCAGGNFQQTCAFALPISVINKWAGEALRGLDFLHRHGIVHRNINSSIIFFTEPKFKGTVKIGGFHNMRQLSGENTQRHEISARHGQDGRFAAPEISNTVYDVSVGRKCDIWSFGCVVLHLVTGHPPLYRGQSGRQIDSEMAVIYHLNHRKKGPEIPEWVPGNVRAFIGQCLQFEPENRPTAAGLLVDMNALAVDGSAEYQRTGDRLPQDITVYWT